MALDTQKLDPCLFIQKSCMIWGFVLLLMSQYSQVFHQKTKTIGALLGPGQPAVQWGGHSLLGGSCATPLNQQNLTKALSPSLFLTALVTEKLCRLVYSPNNHICSSRFGQSRFRTQKAGRHTISSPHFRYKLPDVLPLVDTCIIVGYL